MLLNKNFPILLYDHRDFVNNIENFIEGRK